MKHTTKQLQEQVANPQHCFLLRDGDFMRHPMDDYFGLAGKPMRFTLLAATAWKEQNPSYRICPIEATNGRH